jgi:hypothetical protein
MTIQILDAGVASHSPSTTLMKLVNIHNRDEWTDFNTVVQYIQEHLYDIIHEVHHVFDKLLVDDGETQLNCPPPLSQPNDPSIIPHHDTSLLLLRTLSEKKSTSGIMAQRIVKVYDCGGVENNHPNHNERRIEIRDDIIRAPIEIGQLPIMTEHVTHVQILRKIV